MIEMAGLESVTEALALDEAQACVGGSANRVFAVCLDGAAHDLALRGRPWPLPPIEVGPNPPIPPVIVPLL